MPSRKAARPRTRRALARAASELPGQQYRPRPCQPRIPTRRRQTPADQAARANRQPPPGGPHLPHPGGTRSLATRTSVMRGQPCIWYNVRDVEPQSGEVPSRRPAPPAAAGSVLQPWTVLRSHTAEGDRSLGCSRTGQLPREVQQPAPCPMRGECPIGCVSSTWTPAPTGHTLDDVNWAEVRTPEDLAAVKRALGIGLVLGQDDLGASVSTKPLSHEAMQLPVHRLGLVPHVVFQCVQGSRARPGGKRRQYQGYVFHSQSFPCPERMQADLTPLIFQGADTVLEHADHFRSCGVAVLVADELVQLFDRESSNPESQRGDRRLVVIIQR